MSKQQLKLPTKKTTKSNKAKLTFLQKIVLLMAFLLLAFTVLPIMVVLGIGILPTITIMITDSKNINKITTIGCFNFAGVILSFCSIFGQFAQGTEFSIAANIFNIIIMLGTAGIGFIFYYILPDIFVFIYKSSAQHRLKAINSKLEKLANTWANIIPNDN